MAVSYFFIDVARFVMYVCFFVTNVKSMLRLVPSHLPLAGKDAASPLSGKGGKSG